MSRPFYNLHISQEKEGRYVGGQEEELEVYYEVEIVQSDQYGFRTKRRLSDSDAFSDPTL